MHARPAVHAEHAPSWQTALGPHGVPLAIGSPVSVQTDAPVLHAVIHGWQASAGVHTPPSVHGEPWPPLQTSLTPQGLPFGAAVPVSVQVARPLSHDVAPT